MCVLNSAMCVERKEVEGEGGEEREGMGCLVDLGFARRRFAEVITVKC